MPIAKAAREPCQPDAISAIVPLSPESNYAMTRLVKLTH